MMYGFWSMSAGAATFIPAALVRSYPVFLAGLFTIGAGLAVLQTAANPYITVLGPAERAAQRISIMGICNKAAGISAPLLFAPWCLKATDNRAFQATAPPVAEAKKRRPRRADPPGDRALRLRKCGAARAGPAGAFLAPARHLTPTRNPRSSAANAGRTSILQFRTSCWAQ
jgi:MFS family permease